MKDRPIRTKGVKRPWVVKRARQANLKPHVPVYGPVRATSRCGRACGCSDLGCEYPNG